MINIILFGWSKEEEKRGPKKIWSLIKIKNKLLAFAAVIRSLDHNRVFEYFWMSCGMNTNAWTHEIERYGRKIVWKLCQFTINNDKIVWQKQNLNTFYSLPPLQLELPSLMAYIHYMFAAVLWFNIPFGVISISLTR